MDKESGKKAAVDFDPALNYKLSRKAVGYISRKNATQEDYDRLGFKVGLEVHQQLRTKTKLFCKCPVKIYNDFDDYDAEIIRHMRPTLSELGEYDGTALMEFKTRKIIAYRIKNETACTYDIDDTPPFAINREALDIALEISLLCKLNIVGEVHVIRKQYLDGSIPTGFQRTAILGVEGEIPLANKKIRLIQLSLEEDSCREVSDIGHVRTYQTDRVGIPLIETVTYPDFVNPQEVGEGAEYIRFLNRSTGKVFKGIGSGRQDVNCSCKGGTRVEIKGVSHIKWIPELTHNEVFRQWALLRIRDILNRRVKQSLQWKIKYAYLDWNDLNTACEPLCSARKKGDKIVAVNLPDFKGILSHFTQPGKMFADEISDRIKVIACIEKPHLIHSEQFAQTFSTEFPDKIGNPLGCGEGDAQLVIWGPSEDIPTALETIEERCRLALDGVPRESRKSFEDGTTIFERVLPGPDRMYPDTDAAPISLDDDHIENIRKKLPVDVNSRFAQLREWNVPSDTYTYILSNNLVPTMERVIAELDVNPKFIGTLLGHTVKRYEGRIDRSPDFAFEQIYSLLKLLVENDIELDIAKNMILVIYRYPKMDFNSVLTTIGFKKVPQRTILEQIPFLKNKFKGIRISENKDAQVNWIMGELRKSALGNISLAELRKRIEGREFG
ncbi:MAG: Glu-tRNA(Gln) amidotransferase subunit GatE [Candidatus Aminicenantes bacterium]|nr:Glu-tRNA(Gln) amidotransferase subunit GatE [Candidatus Aminicenantes bacterium]